MQGTERFLSFLALALLLALPLLPLLWAITDSVGSLADFAGALTVDWRTDTELVRATALTVFTGGFSTALAAVLSACILMQWHSGASRWGLVQRLGRILQQGLPAMLATPHAAFAIGLVFLLAPSGWIFRLISPWWTGWQAPPPWQTTQDEWGLGLMVALVCKEVPFLLWTAATQLQREDVKTQWQSEALLAQTLGYSRRRSFWCVLFPQLMPRMLWPMLAVLAYGLVVVDMALVIGPNAPPTLAVLSWQWLQDADVNTNHKGVAAAALLAALLLALVMAAALCFLFTRSTWWRELRLLSGRRGREPSTAFSLSSVLPPLLVAGYVWAYVGVWLALGVGSVTGGWLFPALWPENWTWSAWQQVGFSLDTVWATLGLGLASSVCCTIWSLAWLEWAPRWLDRALRPLFYLTLLLSPVLWVAGLYGLAFRFLWEGSVQAVLFAHCLAVLPYTLIALSPAYLGFDVRYAQLCASLGASKLEFLWRVKWPLLRGAILSAFAVGFAVSAAQYIPTLYMGAGRWQTLATEAIALSSGSQRSLTSAFACLQLALPALVFALAARAAKPRQFK